MDVVGSEIGQKMRSAIKAKLTELGCYVDDELPDYVMVMVANKRTRTQMEDDLQLFLGGNTHLFVNWLHQVLKKLQEVTVSNSLKSAEKSGKSKHSSKDKKDKTKHKKSISKKSKKKEKEKHSKKKEEKKSHKSKKKNEHHDMIRPNIPPLLMNLEKVSEPSITDVFAGQILKNHGITLDNAKDVNIVETKLFAQEVKMNPIPIIDPDSMCAESPIPEEAKEIDVDKEPTQNETEEHLAKMVTDIPAAKEDQINEIKVIESKIQGLKQKLVEQLHSMPDDEDFLNIRTEAEELMNDFADDVLKEITSTKVPGASTLPIRSIQKSPTISSSLPKSPEGITSVTPEALPQIELQLPKRPLRGRLGEPVNNKEMDASYESPDLSRNEWTQSPERFTPDRQPVENPQSHKHKTDVATKKQEFSSRKLTSKVSALENRLGRSGPASVVRVRPRPRPTTKIPASNLLLRAVADAHKSLVNIPPKVDVVMSSIKHALVLPTRRAVEAQKIVIQVPSSHVSTASPARDVSVCEIDIDTESLGDLESDIDNKSSKVNNDFAIANMVHNSPSIKRKMVTKFSRYVPSRRHNKNSRTEDEPLDIDTINIHSTTVDKEKGPKFVVTLDGLDPNIFLTKKLQSEGLIEDDKELKEDNFPPIIKQSKIKTVPSEYVTKTVIISEGKKRLSNTSEDSDIQVIIKTEHYSKVCGEKRKSDIGIDTLVEMHHRKRKASPIVFDVDKKEKPRERTESTGSDNQENASTCNKYDAIPTTLAQQEKLQTCRSFPACRYGSSCAYLHPPCKFASTCSRRNCSYSHPANKIAPAIASSVVPAANYKTISTVALPAMCKFYPNCSNPACHYFHPKPCRYGKTCINKLECNFYHHNVPENSAHKWRSPKV